VRLAGSVAKREVAEQHARYSHVFDDVLGAGHEHGRDAMCLQMPRHETECLMAHRAVRHQHRNVGAVFLATRQDVRTVHLDRVALAAVGWSAVKAACQVADPLATHLLAQQGKWKPAAGVFHAGVLAVDVDMRDAQIVVLLRITRVDREEFGCCVVGRTRTLVAPAGLVRRRSSDQGEPRGR
jgi:hypothetical protein